MCKSPRTLLFSQLREAYRKCIWDGNFKRFPTNPRSADSCTSLRLNCKIRRCKYFADKIIMKSYWFNLQAIKLNKLLLLIFRTILIFAVWKTIKRSIMHQMLFWYFIWSPSVVSVVKISIQNIFKTSKHFKDDSRCFEFLITLQVSSYLER